MSTLFNSIKDDILLYLHTHRVPLADFYRRLYSKDINDLAYILKSLRSDKKLNVLDPTTHIDIGEFYHNQHGPTHQEYVKLTDKLKLLVSVDIDYTKNEAEIIIIGNNKEKVSEIEKYLLNKEYRDVDINFSFDPNDPATRIEVDEYTERPHFISKALYRNDTDYLKLFQILNLEAGNNKKIGRFTGSDLIDLSSSTKAELFLERIMTELNKSKNEDIPKISIVKSDRSMMLCGNYFNKTYIPSMMIITPEDKMIKYDLWGDEVVIKEMVHSLKVVFEGYENSIVNRYNVKTR